MAISASFIEQAKELFQPFGDIRIRKMFGGAGVYCDEMIFALLDDDMVFFKVDEETRKAFVRRGLAPFSYEMKPGERQEMKGYYAAPEEIFDDEDELKRWTTLALDAASRAAKFKKKRKKGGL
ncbi:MAG: TfoX/Sxy family protein [Parvularculaceae bacterium]|nr:TfoX/Sxy family protein [Parvularculaceae bacterium]